MQLTSFLTWYYPQAIPLITHGRYLIHEGQLRQIDVESVVSSSEIHIHLFSDLLLLSIHKYDFGFES